MDGCKVPNIFEGPVEQKLKVYALSPFEALPAFHTGLAEYND
jgi:hypothetical protein